MQQLQPQVMTSSGGHYHEPEWASWSNEKLLSLPMSQLGVTLDGPFLSGQIQQLYAELKARQLIFRPHFWLSNEWFTPDGVPGIAVPFYLAHPRLAKLEMEQMLEVEGGTSNGACEFYGMKRAMPWKMRIVFAASGVANKYLAARPTPIPNITALDPIAGVSCVISMCGMRKAIRMKTLRRPLRSGSRPIRHGPTVIKDGRFSRSFNMYTD